MSEYDNILKIIKLARGNSSQDLHISNEILDQVNILLTIADTNDANEEILKVAETLVKEASKLTEQSNQTSYAISKFVGAVK